jgi:hypothetical protein
LVAAAGFLLLEMAWACVMPLFRGPDEIGHVYRASAVASGQWGPSGGDTPTRASAAIVRSASSACHELYDDFRPEVCTVSAEYSDGTVGVASSADKYNPVFYAVAGLPARFLDGDAAVWGMRVASGVLCALLLGFAWATLGSGARSPVPALAFLLAATPAIAYSGSVFAPNGVQFASAFVLWAGVLVALRDRAFGVLAATACGIGGTLLVVTHTTGTLWLATIMLTVLVLAGWRRLWEVVRARPRAWTIATAAVILAGLGSVAWVLGAATNSPGAGGEPLSQETKDIGVVPNVVLWVLQTVGTMPYRFGILWPFLYLFWLVPLGILLVLGLRRADRRHRTAIVTVVALSVIVPTVLTVMTYDELGIAWQGRYGLPLLIGAVLVAGEALDRAVPPLRRGVLVGLLVTLAVTQYLCVLCIGLRESAGPFDDGRPWGLLLALVAPVLVTGGYALLARPQVARPD